MVAMARIDNDDIHIAFMDGKDAYHHSTKRKDNPYGGDPKSNPEFSPVLFAAWDNGWLAAQFAEKNEMRYADLYQEEIH